jgi:anthranilate phosphoribosyltransferase
LSAIEGGEPEANKKMIEAVLNGQGEEAHQAAIAMNAGALLHLCGKAESYKAGTHIALSAIQKGLPASTIEATAKCSVSN